MTVDFNEEGQSVIFMEVYYITVRVRKPLLYFLNVVKYHVSCVCPRKNDTQVAEVS